MIAVWASCAAAGIISRATKSCGTTSFFAENGLGCTTILASEVDTDFVDILGVINGNISAANVADGTLTTTDLSAAAGIIGGQIFDGTITALDIATNGVETAEIFNGTITTVDISNAAGITGTQIANTTITEDDLGVAATLRSSSVQADETQTALTTSAVVLLTASLTAAVNGPVVLDASLSGNVFWAAAVGVGAGTTVTFRLYRNNACSGTLLREAVMTISINSIDGIAGYIPFALSIPTLDTAHGGGAINYVVCALTSFDNANIDTLREQVYLRALEMS
jgi:hypothetical protein